ncbi:DNA-directed RNA polymerase subunit omega [Thermodesulfovibrio aggregans]|uniref:DNA-directed RNA polymerase subunit omega n=1 Tax=Thermodesulfovibrio aggregans TaxID=86166 RepID=A0A0U9HTB9_9BACT|nr:DNA-directed RNA polymerase subunit omega [Thermodesulfovibrio aggregans]GAQ95673.1 DNA-directed RNA polymerase subunit omega [Thermodesulfovibrio aggregans]
MEKKDQIFDIISLPIEIDRTKIDSRYRLALIAAQRAAELSLGATPKMEKKVKKVTTLSLLEVLSNKIEYITGEEALKAKEKIEHINVKKLLEEKRRAIPDLSELEKDLKVYLNEKESAEKMLEELFSDHSEQQSDEQE